MILANGQNRLQEMQNAEQKWPENKPTADGDVIPSRDGHVHRAGQGAHAVRAGLPAAQFQR